MLKDKFFIVSCKVKIAGNGNRTRMVNSSKAENDGLFRYNVIDVKDIKRVAECRPGVTTILIEKTFYCAFIVCVECS